MLIPQVKSCETRPGVFHINTATEVFIGENTPALQHAAAVLSEHVKKWTALALPITLRQSDAPGGNGIYLDCTDNGASEQYQLSIGAGGVFVCGQSKRSLFWGVQTLSQLIQLNRTTLPGMVLHDYPDFAHRGFYHDVTRGKVPKLDTLKWLADKCAFYKINELQLYIEHSFAFRNFPEVWAGRDPLTAEEIVALDEYCRKNHIDLIPSLASFGHLYELLRQKRFEHLNELPIEASTIPHNLWDRMAHYTIDPSNPESFEVVRAMLLEFLPLFSSAYFNICCDETFDLGKGKNKSRAASEGTGRLYIDFVKKIAGVVLENGKIPMMWGDIVLHYPDLLSELPSETIFLNWGYAADISDESTKSFASAGVKQYVCPGAQGWSRFAYDIGNASKNIRRMIRYGAEHGALGVLNTNWGDCGHVNPLSGALHGLALGAALSWNYRSYSDDSEFDRALSVLEWHDSSVGGLLRELGSLCFYHFGNLYAWVSGTKGLWDKEEQVRVADGEELGRNKKRAEEIRDALIRIRSEWRSPAESGMDELVMGATATAWTLQLLLFKKEREYRQECCEIDKNELIFGGYALLQEFMRLWRLRNKESELSTVVAVFRKALGILQGME